MRQLAPAPARQSKTYFFLIVKEQPITRFAKPEAKSARAVCLWIQVPPAPFVRAASNVGGAGRDRTDGLLLAKQALSQLSYSPPPFASFCSLLPELRSLIGGSGWIRTPCLLRAKQALFQMSYIPWWGILDSNQGPQSYQDCALTT